MDALNKSTYLEKENVVIRIVQLSVRYSEELESYTSQPSARNALWNYLSVYVLECHILEMIIMNLGGMIDEKRQNVSCYI